MQTASCHSQDQAQPFGLQIKVIKKGDQPTNPRLGRGDTSCSPWGGLAVDSAPPGRHKVRPLPP